LTVHKERSNHEKHQRQQHQWFVLVFHPKVFCMWINNLYAKEEKRWPENFSYFIQIMFYFNHFTSISETFSIELVNILWLVH